MLKQLIAGFADIASTGNALISQMDGQEPVQPGPSEDVYNAVRRLVQTYQALLNILIGKAGLLERIPIIGEPVAASLRGVQGALDVGSAPSREDLQYETANRKPDYSLSLLRLSTLLRAGRTTSPRRLTVLKIPLT